MEIIQNLSLLNNNLPKTNTLLTNSHIQNSQQNTKSPFYIHKLIFYYKVQTIGVAVKHIFNTLNQTIYFQYSPAYSIILKSNKKDKTLIAIRWLLKLNKQFQNFIIKINPLTHQITVCNFFLRNLFFTNISLEIQQQIEYVCLNIHQTLFPLLKTILSVIDNLFFLQEIIETQHKTEELQSIKKYIQFSSSYAWNILDGQTQSKNQKKVPYETSKKKFVQSTMLLQKLSQVNQTLKSIFLTPHKKQYKIRFLNALEDNNLFQNYLSKSYITIRNSRQVQDLTVDQKIYQKLISAKQLKIKFTQSSPMIKIAISKVPENKRQSFIYQKQIINKFSKSKGQFLGVPKYFSIQSNNDSSNYSFTNLVNCKKLLFYLEANLNSLSLYTKLQILSQISSALRYIRDHQIVYHNLRPQRVVLKKGIIVTLYDFSNAYHYKAKFSLLIQKQSQHKPYRNIYPYVSNFKTTKSISYNNQKSDAFSFGMLMFQLIFNKNPCSIRKSKLIDLQSSGSDIKKKLQKLLLNQKGFNITDSMFDQMLANFIMKCISHNLHQIELQLSETSSDWSIVQSSPRQIQVLINQRPYLDWINIIIKTFQQLLMNYFSDVSIYQYKSIFV